MEFGIKKCAMLIMNSGKRQVPEGIEQPTQEKVEDRKTTSICEHWKRIQSNKK